MDSEKEKNQLSDIVLERVGLTGNLLSAPVSPSLEPVVEIPSHGSQVRAGKVTGPEEHREDIASLLGEVYRPWDEDGQPGGTPRR